MNPITLFLTVVCLAIGAGLAAIGFLSAGIAMALVAIVVAAGLKMANTWENSSSFAPANCAASKGRVSFSSSRFSTTSSP